MLCENTGAHEELGDCALTVNPFDIEEQADAIHRALTMDPEERRLRAERLREIVDARDPGDWVDEQLADIRAKRGERERRRHVALTARRARARRPTAQGRWVAGVRRRGLASRGRSRAAPVRAWRGRWRWRWGRRRRRAAPGRRGAAARRRGCPGRPPCLAGPLSALGAFAPSRSGPPSSRSSPSGRRAATSRLSSPSRPRRRPRSPAVGAPPRSSPTSAGGGGGSALAAATAARQRARSTPAATGARGRAALRQLTLTASHAPLNLGTPDSPRSRAGPSAAAIVRRRMAPRLRTRS